MDECELVSLVTAVACGILKIMVRINHQITYQLIYSMKIPCLYSLGIEVPYFS